MAFTHFSLLLGSLDQSELAVERTKRAHNPAALKYMADMILRGISNSSVTRWHAAIQGVLLAGPLQLHHIYQ
ncbi:hypothetical protein BDR04DRAFT_745048 [Suillus decipiens]|nr:hypothetical protein BDR04DRAFT_745048 [Suillus decipiens]